MAGTEQKTLQMLGWHPNHMGFVKDKLSLGQVLPSTMVSLANSYSTNCSTDIVINNVVISSIIIIISL
jgi:hypothetical protein